MPSTKVTDAFERGSNGVDRECFLDWAKNFVLNILDLACNEWMIVLVLDGYRSQMGVSVMKLLEKQKFCCIRLSCARNRQNPAMW